MMPCTNGTSKSGQDCILKSSQCNGVIDCRDSSDELSCQVNECFGNFMVRMPETFLNILILSVHTYAYTGK